MLFDLFVWWYGQGWLGAWRGVLSGVKKVQQAFSVPVLLGTLFSPWKQIVSGGGRSIDEKFRAMIDNLVSRTIGFFVRLGALFAALVFTAVAAAVGLATAVIWPAIPAAIVYCLFKGIAG